MSHSLSDLGARLRAIRNENGWRIADVSKMTGLAGSTISKVENGQMSLTYDKLLQLVHGLNLDLSVLFSAKSAQSDRGPVTARRSIGREADINYVDVDWYGSYGYLNTDISNKKMTPIIGEVTARSIKEVGGLFKHSGEEFIYVLSGFVEVHTEFYMPVTLGVGEYMYIDSNMGHAYLASGEGPARFICVCTDEASEGPIELLRNHGEGDRAANIASDANAPQPPSREGGKARPSRRKKRATAD